MMKGRGKGDGKGRNEEEKYLDEMAAGGIVAIEVLCNSELATFSLWNDVQKEKE